MHTPGAKVAEHQPNVRSAERFDLEVTVDLESDHNFYTGLTQNISSGGLFIATHHLRKIGDRITLKFTLPGSGKQIAVETEVRWLRENSALMRAEGGIGMGVRFINLSPEASAAINAFVQSRESLYYDDED
jgi:uncharacterized protein (TIGR02266 family)